MAPEQRRPAKDGEAEEPATPPEEYDTETLISCLTNFSLTGDGDTSSGPAVTRFPKAPPPREVSELGTREEQRRIYLGPKLSDRATGGPDAGPLIERFSCLFKDRE